MATELITNAIRHGRPLPSDELAVHWSTDGEDVLIRVTDGGGSSQPTLMNSGPEDTNGRGLAIVDSLASSWGVDVDTDRVTVWANVPALAVDMASPRCFGRRGHGPARAPFLVTTELTFHVRGLPVVILDLTSP